MKKVYEKVIIVIFTAIISITMILSCTVNLNKMRSSLSENKDAILDFSLSEEYAETVISSIDSAINDSIFLRGQYIDIYGGLQKLMFKDIIWDTSATNTIMVGSDNKLYSVGNVTANVIETTYDKATINSVAQKIEQFSSSLKELDIPLLFLQAPARYDSTKVTLPLESSSDFDVQKVDDLYEMTKDYDNFTAINLQNIYKEQNKNFEDLFFRTDHHWNIKTAFWAYSELCKTLNEAYNFNINSMYYNLENYNIETRKNVFSGSLGVRVGSLFTQKDDFDYIYPKFDTNYEKIICKVDNKDIASGGSISYSGDFLNAIISDYYDSKVDSSTVTYGQYISSDRSEVIIKNSMSATSKKVLIIKDSFALPVSAFLSTCFAETRLLDLRYEHSQTIYEYVQEYNPDAVILIYNAGAYSDNFFNFY